MKNNKHIRKQLMLAILMLFVGMGSIFAQVSKTVGTRITDNTTEKALETNAILDLDSTTKGFFLPRMNTAQRGDLEAKVKASGRGNSGLAIYNTDIDCVEYWNARTSKWMSLCGSLPPAKLDIDGDCSSVTVLGMGSSTAPIWQQGTPLEPGTHMIQIKVKVEQIGTYQISANSNNGYFFSTEGQFQAPGYYPLVLKGMGTPVVGYDETTGLPGDKLVFSFNGIESTACKNSIIAIKPADLKLKIVGGTYKAAGKYFMNVAASSASDKGNALEITVDVETPGTATISAENAVLGIKFSGTKTFVVGNGQKMLLTPVAGEATPKENGENNYILTFKANTKDQVATINGNTASIVVEKTEISFDKNKVDFGKEPMYQGTALNSKHEVTIPIKVIASGKTNLKLRNAEGVELEAKDVVFNMVSDPNQIQNVVFKLVPNNTVKMPESTTSEFTLTGDGKRFAVSGGDKVTFNLGKKPVAYTIDCSTIKSNRSAIPYNQAIGKGYFITMDVNVDVAGEYEIYVVEQVDNVKFSSNQNGQKMTFPGTGKQKVTLYAEDETKIPTAKGDYMVTIASKDGIAIPSCGSKFPVKIGYNDLKVLYYYVKSTINGDSYVSEFIKGGNRFGVGGSIADTGDVSVETFVVSDKTTNTVAKRKEIADNIRANKYNLIVVEGMMGIRSFDAELEDAFYKYITANKAIYMVIPNASGTVGSKFFNNVIGVTNNYAEAPIRTMLGIDMIKKLNNGNDFDVTSSTKTNGASLVNRLDPFVNGYKTYTTYKMEWNNSSNLMGVKTTGTNFEAIASMVGSDKDKAYSFRHLTYRYFYLTASTYDNGDVYEFDGVFTSTGAIRSANQYNSNDNTLFLSANILINMIKKVAND